MKTNAFFQLFVAVVCVMCVGCTGKRKAQPVDVLAKETPPAVQSPEVTDDTLAVEEPDTETSTDNLPRPVAMAGTGGTGYSCRPSSFCRFAFHAYGI